MTDIFNHFTKGARKNRRNILRSFYTQNKSLSDIFTCLSKSLSTESDKRNCPSSSRKSERINSPYARAFFSEIRILRERKKNTRISLTGHEI